MKKKISLKLKKETVSNLTGGTSVQHIGQSAVNPCTAKCC